MNKENVGYTYNGMLAKKKSEILPFSTTQMDLKDIVLNWNKWDRDKLIWSHLYVESKKQNQDTHRYRE